MVAPRDTTSEAFARQMERLRSISPQERLRRSLEMSDELRQIAMAGIRARHPDYDDRQVREAFEIVILGPVLARAVRRARSNASP